MPRFLRSRAIPNLNAWNAFERRRAIARHTVPADRARMAFRHVVAAAKSGTVPESAVTGLFARTLQQTRDDRHPFALISAKCASRLRRSLDLTHVGMHRWRLEAGLMAATYDTWNLPKYFADQAALCLYGNAGYEGIMRDTRNLLVVRADAAKYAERREHCLDRDPDAIMRF
jgi:hypothetical protein